MMEEIIVIGAGPAGLMAAYELTKQGRRVLLLEARDHVGGRAHTIYHGADHFEAGAEFVHGSLPVTLSLLKDAELAYTPTGGTWVQLRSGATSEVKDADHWPQFMRKLKSIENDVTLQDFLEEHFAGNEYAALKDQAISYAEGYDTADAARVSAKALYEEWSHEEEEEYRIDKGYTALMSYLAAEVGAHGGRILLSTPVMAVEVAENVVRIETAGQAFETACAVIALPLGVLQSPAAIKLSIPATYTAAIADLGIGDVIKFVCRFRESFWEREYPGLGFLLSGAPVPTWWTQAPADNGVITGWMAGRTARSHAHLSEAMLADSALDSLAQIFSMSRAAVDALLIEAHVLNWSEEPFTRGSYAYTTLGANAALQVLRTPVEDRIFFAGEYMYSGTAMGTVEAAFESGRRAAHDILNII